jgi:hypothetical protein
MADAKREWIAVAISVAALIVSIIGAIMSYRTANDALDEARRQFQESGPVLIMTRSQVDIWNSSSGGSWLPSEQKGTSIEFEKLRSPYTTYVVADVRNTGRSDGSVTEFGLLTQSDKPVAVSGTQCVVDKPPSPSPSPGASKTMLTQCKFPITLIPGAVQTFYVPMSGIAQDLLTCNTYVQKSGLVPYARAGDQSLISRSTEVSTAYASYCRSLPPGTR